MGLIRLALSRRQVRFHFLLSGVVFSAEEVVLLVIQCGQAGLIVSAGFFSVGFCVGVAVVGDGAAIAVEHLCQEFAMSRVIAVGGDVVDPGGQPAVGEVHGLNAGQGFGCGYKCGHGVDGRGIFLFAFVGGLVVAGQECALAGGQGDFRSHMANTLGAKNDLEAVSAWLSRYNEKPSTQRSYRKEAERFLLWCAPVSYTHLTLPPSDLV